MYMKKLLKSSELLLLLGKPNRPEDIQVRVFIKKYSLIQPEVGEEAVCYKSLC